MAIIKCPECGGTLSTLAKQCVHCGVQISTCPSCQNVWVGGGSFCPKCGCNINEAPSASEDTASNIAEPDCNSLESEPATEAESKPENKKRYIIEATLRNFSTESIIANVKNAYPGGLKFLSKFFDKAFIVLMPLSIFVPTLTQMPTESTLLWSALSLNVAFAFLVMGIIFSIFNDAIAYSRLVTQIKEGKYDVNARISYELNNGWENLNRQELSVKKTNLNTLITAQARQSNGFLRVGQYVIHIIAFLLFGAPLLEVGWNLIVIPIFFSISGNNTGIATMLPIENLWLAWGACIILYIIACLIPYIIYFVIMGSISKAIRKKWVRENLPDDFDAYSKNM